MYEYYILLLVKQKTFEGDFPSIFLKRCYIVVMCTFIFVLHTLLFFLLIKAII